MSKLLDGRVLLLNASYEVLGTVGVARATALTFRRDSKALIEVQETDENGAPLYLRDGRGNEYAKPSVIRLKKMCNRKARKPPQGQLRTRIYIRDDFTCQYCAKQFHPRELNLDHILPRCQGGKSTPQNLVTSCIKCNSRKADRTPEQARMPLICSQEELKLGLDKVLLCHYAETRPDWKPYLEYDKDIKQALDKRAAKRLSAG